MPWVGCFFKQTLLCGFLLFVVHCACVGCPKSTGTLFSSSTFSSFLNPVVLFSKLERPCSNMYIVFFIRKVEDFWLAFSILHYLGWFFQFSFIWWYTRARFSCKGIFGNNMRTGISSGGRKGGGDRFRAVLVSLIPILQVSDLKSPFYKYEYNLPLKPEQRLHPNQVQPFDLLVSFSEIFIVFLLVNWGIRDCILFFANCSVWVAAIGSVLSLSVLGFAKS